MSLFLHCGADPMTRSQIDALETPAPLGKRHRPVAHGEFIELVTDALANSGLTVKDEQYGAYKDGNRFFGLMELTPIMADAPGDFGLMVGLRGSHDRTIARGLVIGSRVFVCDNLAFSGEIEISTKQTLNVWDRLPGMVHEAVGTLPGQFELQEARFDEYKRKELTSETGDAALVEMIRRDIITGSNLARALKEWDEPSHEEHAETRSAWRLMQAVTESLKAPIDPETNRPTRAAAPAAMERTVRMTRFLDEVCDFKAAA